MPDLDKLRKLNNIANLGSIAIAALGAHLPTIYQNAIQANMLWERRDLLWQARYNEADSEYRDALEAYKSSVKLLVAYGSDPVHTAEYFDANWIHCWHTIKEILEIISQSRLPDIKPSDAIELSKETPFSAEQWYQGCTDKERILNV